MENTLATHISKDDIKMKFGVYIDYQFTNVYAKSSVTYSELIKKIALLWPN